MGFFKKDSELFRNLSSGQSFFMGAGWGIALTSTLLLLTFMVVLLGSGSPLFKITSAESEKTTNTNTNQQAQPPTQPAADFSKIPAVSSADYIKGDKNAKLTLIEYSDFQCPYCSKHVPTIEKILQDYKGKVRVVFRHFPLSFHANAQKAAEAAECAGEQGKFWEMHDKMFADQSALSIDNLKSDARTLGLNTSKFNDCLDSGKYTDKVKKQMAEGSAGGVTGTPATFVGDQLVKGAVPYETFKAVVESKLK